jgi:hypothetical protein
MSRQGDSAPRNADKPGGTRTRTESVKKQSMNLSAQNAESHSPYMGITTGSTALMNATSRPGSREVRPMTHEQFEAEILYLASIEPFVKMRDKGIITDEDFAQIQAFLLEKYSPIFIKK